MKMKNVFSVAILAVILCICGTVRAATYGGGSGTTADPYQIRTAEQMNTIGANSGDWGSCFELMADIDMSVYTGTEYNIIGNATTKFSGTFDGNNHVIRNLTYNSPTTGSVGLFGEISKYAEIKNVGLENVAITGNSFVGALIGYRYQSDVNNCYSTGSVNGTNYVGGLVGINQGTMNNCHSTATVTGTGTGTGIGGLIGNNSTGSLSNCYATGNVNGWTYAGGLIGSNNGGTVDSSYATGNVSGENGYAGGLIGIHSGTTVSNCYSTGAVSGSNTVGGLIGTNSKTVKNCYSTGAVSGGTYEFGGLVGYNNGPIFKSFWDNQTSQKTMGMGGGFYNPNEVFGKTTAQMKTPAIFTNAGWDFSSTDGDPADWWMPANSYPQLTWPIVGDIAGSYGVNFVDFAVFAAHWDQTDCPTGCENADINNSGTVDLSDLMLFADNWLKGV